MRKAILVVLATVALAVPNVQAFAAIKAKQATSKKKVVTTVKTFTGTLGSADRWGDVQVTIVVRKTTTTVLATGKKTVSRRITKVTVPEYPNHTDRSIFISENALPILVQETLRSQSTGIDLVSGATYTSQGFVSSLQSAILQAKKA
jgi:uncharacterized protein with FMN-binding domain